MQQASAALQMPKGNQIPELELKSGVVAFTWCRHAPLQPACLPPRGGRGKRGESRVEQELQQLSSSLVIMSEVDYVHSVCAGHKDATTEHRVH